MMNTLPMPMARDDLDRPHGLPPAARVRPRAPHRRRRDARGQPPARLRRPHGAHGDRPGVPAAARRAAAREPDADGRGSSTGSSAAASSSAAATPTTAAPTPCTSRPPGTRRAPRSPRRSRASTPSWPSGSTPEERARLNELLRTLIAADPARLIPPELADVTGFLLIQAHYRARDRADAVFRPLGIEVRHYALLVTLDQLGPTSQQAIADGMRMSAHDDHPGRRRARAQAARRAPPQPDRPPLLHDHDDAPRPGAC